MLDTTTFSQPQRQSLVAVLQIIFKTYRFIVRQLWPFLVVLLIGGSQSSFTQKLSIGLVVIAVLSMIVSVIQFFRFTFHIQDSDLIVHRGVLIRKKLVLPFERIQSINIEQNLIHRLAGVVGMRIDTAGSSQEEITFAALSSEKADALRAVLLRDRNLATTTDFDDVDSKQVEPSPDQVLIHEVPFRDLLMIGLTENHIRSGWIIIAFGFWLFSELEGIGLEAEELLPSLQVIAVMIGYLIVAFALASLLISIARTVFLFYGLKFLKADDGFRLEYGLFTKQSITATANKIQTVAWKDNILRKLVGLYHLRIKQAGSQATTSRKSLTIAGIRREGINHVLEDLYGRVLDQGVDYQSVDISWRNRRWLFVSIPLVLLSTVLLYFDNYWLGSGVLLLAMYWTWTTYRAYRKLGYCIIDGYLLLSGGSWGDYRTVIPFHKLQFVQCSTSPYQRRNNLASIKIKTAAGTHSVPYLPATAAHYLHDRLLYEVITTEQSWI